MHVDTHASTHTNDADKSNYKKPGQKVNTCKAFIIMCAYSTILPTYMYIHAHH